MDSDSDLCPPSSLGRLTLRVSNWTRFRCLRSDCISNGESDGPHCAAIHVEHSGSANLFDKPPNQTQSMSLTVCFGLEADAVVPDGHCRHADSRSGKAHQDSDSPLAAGEGVLIAVG